MVSRMVANGIFIKRDSTRAFYHSCGALLEGQISFFSSIGPPAAAREAFKKLWPPQDLRSKIRGRNFGFKLKFYYANRPLGTRKWHQNLNW